MSRLAESTVQREAIEFLRKRYQRYSRSPVFADTEMRTRRQFGSKRADGLIAYRHWLWGPLVVSIEAKSFRTLNAIRPRRDWKRFLVNCALAGLLISVLSGGFFALFKLQDGYWQFLIPAAAFILGGTAYGLLTRKHFGHRTVDMIQQSRQYPANRRWLAISDDSLRRLTAEKERMLRRTTRALGVGLLLVREPGKVDIINKPALQFKLFGDYLDVYAREKEIRQVLG